MKNAKKKKTVVVAVLAVAVLLFLYGFYRVVLAPDGADLQAQEYGSFTPGDAESFDGRFTAVQKVEKLNDMNYVRVDVYDNESGELADSFLTERAWDFWGICWENDNYNLWIQSADVGIFCYSYEDGAWSRDNGAERPEYIVSRWEAKAAKETF